jgi:DHA2 family multidrug resistance protein-like MFS transporter
VTNVTTQRAQGKAGRREWIGLAVIALPCLLYSMDLTVLNLAVPAITRDLEPSSVELLWIVDIYGFLVAGSLITMGTLGDRIGRRRLLMIGAAAFGAASVLAAFSTSAAMLIAARALLGVAGATLAPSTLALIFNMFCDPGERKLAIGVWIASFSAGAAVGPLVGGALLELFWWGSVFLAGVPVMVLLLVLGPRLLPESRDPDAGRLDLFSAALSLVAVLAVIYGLKRFAEGGTAWWPALVIVTGLGVGAAFLRRQTRLADPLIDLDLFRIRTFSAGLAANTMGFFAAFGLFLLVSQYLQIVLGLSPLEAGLWSLPSSAGFIAGAMVVPMLLHGVRPAYVIGSGLALASMGFVLISQADGLDLVVAGSVVFSLGLSPVAGMATELIVGAAPPERSGAASAISETSSEFGGALGIAMLGSIGTAVYRDQMQDAVPAGVPGAAAETARETAGGAATASEELPHGLATALLDAGRDAFAASLQAAAITSAVVTAIAAALALVLLRHARTGAPPAAREASGEPVAAPASA